MSAFRAGHFDLSLASWDPQFLSALGTGVIMIILEIAQTPAEEFQFSKQLGLPDPVDPVLIDPLGDVS